MSDRIYLKEGWEFTPEFSEEFLAGSREGQPVRLPHTCAETPYNYFSDEMYQMVSGYRRKLFAPLQWKGKRVLLTLEGAAHDAEVFVNGVKAGSHHCGYTAITLDLSAF